LALVACLPPLMVVAAIGLFKGDIAFVLAPLAMGLPLAHMIRFPSAWMETLAVSITLTILLVFVGMIGPDVGLFGLALRILGVAALGGKLVLILTPIIAMLIGVGTPPCDHASRDGSLAPFGGGVAPRDDTIPWADRRPV